MLFSIILYLTYLGVRFNVVSTLKNITYYLSSSTYQLIGHRLYDRSHYVRAAKYYLTYLRYFA